MQEQLNQNTRDTVNLVMKTIKEIGKFLPSLTEEDITIVYKKVIEETNKKDFFSFKEGKGDYPFVELLPDEEALKNKIYSSFKKESRISLGYARYELIDKVLARYENQDVNVQRSFYLFLMVMLHLGYKIIFNISSITNINRLAEIFTNNLDYMMLYSAVAKDATFRDGLDPVKYFDRDTNTIGYNKNINVANIDFVLDISENGINDKTDLYLGLFTVLDKNSESQISYSARLKFQELITIYLCILMHESGNTIAVCHECQEIYINQIVNEKKQCLECWNNEVNKTPLIIYKK